ncbi:MAG: hypothetical protein ACYDAE_07660 [Steroidobacteraceae bacterium]
MEIHDTIYGVDVDAEYSSARTSSCWPQRSSSSTFKSRSYSPPATGL